ncbi:hypothetical protein [Marinobacterium arenosum]|uniref:hypothetical protein n=1 Tax=Marinobacterium arenosum TaxID=2862496 RepID=UPI001C9759EA|nr:hypothetical protein [Marinobacterium arenosum]MBY4677528.1 hypothetical protein [Marinobacterium arenosum]
MPCADWQSLAELRPQLHPHVQLHRQRNRNRVGYMLEDLASGQCYRLSEESWRCVGLMDGRHSLAQIDQQLTEQLGEQAPGREALMQLMEMLHCADLVQCGLALDNSDRIQRRYTRQALWRQWLRNPLALRIPLIDPDRFLERWLWLARPLFSRWGLLLWLALVLSAAFQAWLNWPALSDNPLDRILSTQNLLLLWLCYPLLKALHEFGHAFATKAFGGEVHEMGVVFILLVPLPYVNASSATAFAERSRRIWVSAAGIMTDLLLASLALFIWLQVEPGRISALAYSVVLLGSVSTLLFNGNPLLRFDGYYLLCDLVGLPNLGPRAGRYLGYLYLRYLVGEGGLQSPANDRSEAAWFVGYGIAAWCYRLFILALITLFAAEYSLVLGAFLAAWLLLTMLLAPLAKGLLFLCLSPRLRARRLRGLSLSLALLGLAVAGLALVPVPHATHTEALVWLPPQAELRAGADGFIDHQAVADGNRVHAGQVLLVSQDPQLHAEEQLLLARLKEQQARLTAVQASDRVQANLVRETLRTTAAELARLRERQAALTLHSPGDGILVLPDAGRLAGRFHNQGALLGYVINDGQPRVRAVVSQDQIGQIRQHTEAIEVRLETDRQQLLRGRIVAEQPAATHLLPGAALNALSGGRIAVDPADPQGRQALEGLFLIDVALPVDTRLRWFGGRAHVRFSHGEQPLLGQWYRRLRQLFLKRLDY